MSAWLWALLFGIICFITGVIVGQLAALRGPIKRWCVFDLENPQENQTIVEARTPDEAMARAAQEVFGLGIEEAE